VNENVLAILAADKTIALGIVKPLYCSCFHDAVFLCVEVCAGIRRIVQAGHALERGTAEQPQRSNAIKLYIFGGKWLQFSVLTEVIRAGTHFPDTLPKILGFGSPFFRVKLKNKARRLLAGFLLSA
jgi:hypothetical protein